MAADDSIPCPFVYADGHGCLGVVYRARAYGPTRGGTHPRRKDVRKYRLWCSKCDDHAGAVPSVGAKLRMEFFPDRLGAGVEDRLWQGNLLN
jgi:hypothetical protein